MFGSNFIEIAAILLERLPGEAEETRYNTRIATVSYQMLAEDVYTQIEKPLNIGTYKWNDGTEFHKDLSDGVFWSGPNRNYQVAGTDGYGNYEVYDDNFTNAIATIHYTTGDSNFYTRTFGKRKLERRGIYIYGFETEIHYHAAGLEPGQTDTKEYWLEARNE